MGELSRRRGSPSCTQRTAREKPTWALTSRAILGRSRIAWSLRCLTCLSPRSGLSNMQSMPRVPFLGLTRSSWQSAPEVQSPETPVEEWTRMMTRSNVLRTFTLLSCICENFEYVFVDRAKYVFERCSINAIECFDEAWLIHNLE